MTNPLPTAGIPARSLAQRASALAYLGITVVSLIAGEPRVIMRGDYADPTILRDGEDYYMTHSAFVYKPGFLILHSRNLVDWEPVVRAVPEFEGSAYAPDLAKVNGKYYLYFPAARVNWVVTADNIRGPWSKPIKLEVGKIDPGHAVGEDGKRYLFLSAGNRIRLSDDGLSVTGEMETVYAGWDFPPDWKTEGKWLESPKIFRHGGFFYLVSAEGGTAGPPTSHMAIVARSKSIDGPWENSPHNPLIHTYNAAEKWWSKGHGSIIDDANGNWWIVYHAYENGQYPLGRQTLLEPLEWTQDGWPILSKTWSILPGGSTASPKRTQLSDDFAGPQLGIQWTGWGEAKGSRFEAGTLILEGKGEFPVDARRLLVTAEDASYEIEAEVTIASEALGGVTLFYNERAFVALGYDGNRLLAYVDGKVSEMVLETGSVKSLTLKIVNRGNRGEFMVKPGQSGWQTVASGIDVSGLHHNNYKGFLALRPGIFAAGQGNVRFHSFTYRPIP